MSHYTPQESSLSQASTNTPLSQQQVTASYTKTQSPQNSTPSQESAAAAFVSKAKSKAKARGTAVNDLSLNLFPRWIRSNRMGFLAAGFAIAAWAPIIPFVKERFGLDEHGLGLLLLCVGAGSLFSSPLSGVLTSRFGCKIPIFGASITWAICIGLISVVQNMHLMALILFIFGMASVILEVVSNINGALIERVTGKTVMSGLHALYSLGGLLGSFGVTFILGAGAGVVLAASVAAIFMLTAVLLGGKYLFNHAQLASEEHQDPAAPAAAVSDDAAPAAAAGAAAAENGEAELTSQIQKQQEQLNSAVSKAQKELPDRLLQKRYVLHPTVLLVSFMLFVLYLTEGAMLDWSGVFLHEERGVDLEMAGYGYATFAIMMTTFRFLGDRIVMRIGRRRIIVLGTLLICAGFCTSALVDHVYSNLLCFALIGIGSSNVIPQLVSYVAKCRDVPMHIAVTLVNSFGFTGVLIGPALIGFVAHFIGLPYTFVLLGIFVLTITFLSYRYIRSAQRPMPQGSAKQAPAPDPAIKSQP